MRDTRSDTLSSVAQIRTGLATSCWSEYTAQNTQANNLQLALQKSEGLHPYGHAFVSLPAIFLVVLSHRQGYSGEDCREHQFNDEIQKKVYKDFCDHTPKHALSSFHP